MFFSVSGQASMILAPYKLSTRTKKGIETKKFCPVFSRVIGQACMILASYKLSSVQRMKYRQRKACPVFSSVAGPEDNNMRPRGPRGYLVCNIMRVVSEPRRTEIMKGIGAA